MTESDFINNEIRVWGFDYIESLLEEGYEPKRTSKGWTWVNEPTPALINVGEGSLALSA